MATVKEMENKKRAQPVLGNRREDENADGSVILDRYHEKWLTGDREDTLRRILFKRDIYLSVFRVNLVKKDRI